MIPVDGRYNGDITVSYQSTLDNASMSTTLRRPLIERSHVGVRIISDYADVCISNQDIKSVKSIKGDGKCRSFIVYYDNAKTYMSVVLIDK